VYKYLVDVDAFAGLYAETLHAKDTVALIIREVRPVVGASGCVHGVNSFSLVLFCWNLLSCRCASSPSLGGPLAVVKSCVKALWNFAYISSCYKEVQYLGVGIKEYALWGGDNVGHTAHGGGAAFGVAFAVMCCSHSWTGGKSHHNMLQNQKAKRLNKTRRELEIHMNCSSRDTRWSVYGLECLR
jgi:hypothetical protein